MTFDDLVRGEGLATERDIKLVLAREEAGIREHIKRQNTIPGDVLHQFRTRFKNHVLYGGEEIPENLGGFAHRVTDEGYVFDVRGVSYYPSGLQLLILQKQLGAENAPEDIVDGLPTIGLKPKQFNSGEATFLYTPEPRERGGICRHVGRLTLPSKMEIGLFSKPHTTSTPGIVPKLMLVEAVGNLERGYATIYTTDETLSAWSIHCAAKQ